ncbi:MAG: NIPSNAP family protein [Planctomycetes bacterium]|nr:NIPSNAP family protein [Planctomycetota bacterium]NBY02555.1 NIPSNAP family protein [Planctomycetota bacterium]
MIASFKNSTIVLVATLTLGALNCIPPINAQEAKTVNASKTERVFEMRTYYAEPGKMDALHARFRDHTCKLFEKHGITIIGFWKPTDKTKAEDMMVYILAYPSKEAADASWKGFRADPAWNTARDASEKNGKLVKKVESVFLNPTDYSPIK